MLEQFLAQHLRFHLEPKAPLHMPAYNKGSTARGAKWGQGRNGDRLVFRLGQQTGNGR
jgi:hypothetical protein